MICAGFGHAGQRFAQGPEIEERKEVMKKLVISFQQSVVRLWRERWNALAGLVLFGILYLIAKTL